MDILQPSSEIVIDTGKQAWIENEVRNFAGTLLMLIDQCPDCREHVYIEHLI